MTSLAATLGRTLGDEIRKLRNRKLLEASMASSALVAMADRDVRLSEQMALDSVLEKVEQLRIYDPVKAVDLHRRYVDALREDPVAGREQVVQALICPGGPPFW